MLSHLTDVSIRSLLLASAAALVLLALRSRRTAAFQHAIWTMVVVGMLGLVAFGATLPRLPLPVFDRQSVAPLRSTPQVWEAPTFGEKSELPASVPSMPSRSIDWSELALYAYTTITFVFLLRFVTGMLLARRLLTRSNPAGPGFLESAMIAAPLTIGVTRPKILLPLGWRKWDRDKLNAVLAHEGAHVGRRDALVAALAGINRCIFWFHPMAWWLERRLSLLAELACDEACLATLGDRESYARLLLEMASVVDGTHGRLRSHALTMAAGSHLRQRVESILKDGREPSRGLRRTGWAAIALCGIPVVLCAGTVEFAAPLPLLPPAPTEGVYRTRSSAAAAPRPGAPGCTVAQFRHAA